MLLLSMNIVQAPKRSWPGTDRTSRYSRRRRFVSKWYRHRVLNQSYETKRRSILAWAQWKSGSWPRRVQWKFTPRPDFETIRRLDLIPLWHCRAKQTERRSHQAMLDFRIGDRVTFNPEGRGEVTGMLIRYKGSEEQPNGYGKIPIFP